MGKFSKYQVPRNQPSKDLHPTWRGIGCLLWIIAPFMSYAFAVLIVGALGSVGLVPSFLLGRIPFPDWTYTAPVIGPIVTFLGGLYNVLAVVVFFIPMLVILSGLFSLLYSWLYRVIGPPRYTAQDAPEIRNRKVRKSR
jgi:hypothetical protein